MAHTRLDPDHLIRRLHQVVGRLYDGVRAARDEPLSRTSDPRQAAIAQEIRAIAQETGRPLESSFDGRSLATILGTSSGSAAAEATDRYCHRVAFWGMTRLVLCRVAEDTGFIAPVLGRGCGAKWRSASRDTLPVVVAKALAAVADRYPKLFGVEMNYSWYSPSPDTWADVLAMLEPFDLKGLDCDVLGPVYEAYLDGYDRRLKGQYYTPRLVVRFVWDRVGLVPPSQSPHGTDGHCSWPSVLDFSTGSGGFLVEAARRIRQGAMKNRAAADQAEILAAIAAITENLCGAEVSEFAAGLAEVNLLVQLTPLLAALQRQGGPVLRYGPDYDLSVLHADALALTNQPPERFWNPPTEAADPTTQTKSLRGGPKSNWTNVAFRSTKGSPLSRSERRQSAGLVQESLESTLRGRLQAFCQADYVCSNPPYVGEKGNKELFRRVLRAFPEWKAHYQGKMDYFYWFVMLGLSKLRLGGRLGYITTGYWHTADGAALLRRAILDHAKIIEMIDFGPARLFSDAPGQHNMIFVLERCEDATERGQHRPTLVEVKREVDGPTARERTERLLDHLRQHVRSALAESYEDDVIRVFTAPVAQGELSERPWHLFHHSGVEDALGQLALAGDPLGKVCEHVQGVVSGADRVTPRHLGQLPAALVERDQIRPGDGIFVLTEAELARMQLSPAEHALARPTYKNSQVARYAIDYDAPPRQFLLYLTSDCGFSADATPTLFVHLHRFQPILGQRRECHKFVGSTGRPVRAWYELHWPRNPRILEGEKIVIPRRSAKNRFAYVKKGCCENSDLAVLAKRPGVQEGLYYFLALLNSAALDFWCEYRGKKKGRIREYYGTPLARIPLRRIRFLPVAGAAMKASLLGELRSHLVAEQYALAIDAVRRALHAGQEDIVHDALELLVARMIELTERLYKIAATDQTAREIGRAMAATQAVIDEVVLDLYGIDDAAMRRLIVEGREAKGVTRKTD